MRSTVLPSALPVIHAVPSAADETRGMLLGLAGVAIFSLTLPCTRLAVRVSEPLSLQQESQNTTFPLLYSQQPQTPVTSAPWYNYVQTVTTIANVWLHTGTMRMWI